MNLKLDAGFFEELEKGVIIVFAESNVAFYPGIDQHLGAEYTGGVSDVQRAALQTHAVQACLDDGVLLGVNAAADFMPCPRRYL